MKWADFEPQPEDELVIPRLKVMMIEGLNPLEPIRPIESRGAPRRCVVCNTRLPFDRAQSTCSGECTDGIRRS